LGKRGAFFEGALVVVLLPSFFRDETQNNPFVPPSVISYDFTGCFALVARDTHNKGVGVSSPRWRRKKLRHHHPLLGKELYEKIVSSRFVFCSDAHFEQSEYCPGSSRW
jgi:hypothetical protein